MDVKVHTVQGFISGALLYPFIQEKAIVFGLSVIFIDLDHVLSYVFDTGSFNPQGFFTYYKILLKNADNSYLALSLFHTIEFYLIVLFLASFFPILYSVLLGFLFHHLFDLFFLLHRNSLFIRANSVIEYALRRKNHVVSLKYFAKIKPLNIEEIPFADKWLTKWGIAAYHEKTGPLS